MKQIAKRDKLFIVTMSIMAYLGIVWMMFYIQTWTIFEVWFGALIVWLLLLLTALTDYKVFF